MCLWKLGLIGWNVVNVLRFTSMIEYREKQYYYVTMKWYDALFVLLEPKFYTEYMYRSMISLCVKYCIPHWCRPGFVNAWNVGFYFVLVKLKLDIPTAMCYFFKIIIVPIFLTPNCKVIWMKATNINYMSQTFPLIKT